MSIKTDFTELDNEIDRILSMSEFAILKNYAAVLETLRTTVRKLFDKHEKEGKLSITEMTKYDRLLKMENEVEKSLSKLYNENSSITKALLNDTFIRTVEKTIDSLDKAVNGKIKVQSLIPIKKTLDIDKTVNERMAGLHWSERLGKHRSDVVYSVNKTLKEGLAQGSTYKELSDRLKKELEGNVVQPMRIIRTEGGRVYASAQEESLDKISSAGVRMTKTWKTSKDERVRSKHVAMEGITVPYEEDFILPDGKSTKMPRLSGYAEHDIHCRCFVTVDVLKDSSKNLRNINIQLFANEDLKKQSLKSISKGINSTKRQITTHMEKIKNPQNYIKGWDKLDDSSKEGMKRHWETEIRAFEKNIKDAQVELTNRGE